MGGKYFLLDKLLPLIPPHRAYVEVFGGGASLLLNKPPSTVEVYNDIDGELVNLFMVVRDHPSEFVRAVASLPYGRELYEKWQKAIKRNALKGGKVERAARFYFLLRSSFFGHVEKGWRFAVKSAEAHRLYTSLCEIEAIARRLQDVYVDHLDFHRCLKNWNRPDTFFFLDPPYFNSTAYRHGVRPFTLKDHMDLAAATRTLRAKWLLTYNDCPKVRELYRRCVMVPVKTSMQTRKVQAGDTRPQLDQLAIANYPGPSKVPLRAWKDAGIPPAVPLLVIANYPIKAQGITAES